MWLQQYKNKRFTSICHLHAERLTQKMPTCQNVAKRQHTHIGMYNNMFGYCVWINKYTDILPYAFGNFMHTEITPLGNVCVNVRFCALNFNAALNSRSRQRLHTHPENLLYSYFNRCYYCGCRKHYPINFKEVCP